MFKFVFVMFFFFVLLVFLMGFSILRTFKRILFGSGNSAKKGGQRRKASHSSSSQRSSASSVDEEYSSPISRKKIFTKDEGEYVDYEEVK